MSLHHGWGWQPPQTASHIHLRHIQSVWALWYTVHGHVTVASNSYTHLTWIRFWGSGSLVESKWCGYVMVEANSHLKLLPASILDICKSFLAHWYTGLGHMAAASNSNTHTTWVRFWGSGSLLVGKSIRNSAKFHNYSNSGPFELHNFHRNFIFLIVKCVPANSEHISFGSESSPAIHSSNFMNRKTFPLYMSVASVIKFRDSTHQLFLCSPLPQHCSWYLPDTHKFMKTLLTYQGIGMVVGVPIQAKMDYDDEDLTDFQFGSSQESKIDSPLVLDSVWDCLGITLDTIIDDDGKTILGWHCSYCLIPGNRGGSRFFKHSNASKALLHLTKGKDIVTCTGLGWIPANVVHALTTLMYSKANRKCDIAGQKNNLHEEVEQQQDCVLGARIDR